MSPELPSPEAKEPFIPSEATKKAWEAQAFMREYGKSELDSPQAEAANDRANEAFDELTALTQGFLWASAYGRTGGNFEDIKEILQDTYLRGYKYLLKFRGESQVETWLHRIMFNRLSSFYEKKAKQPLLEIDNRGVSTDEAASYLGSLAIQFQSEPELAHERSENLERLRELLSTLSPKHQKIVIMQAYYGYSQARIAHLLDMSEGAVKVSYHRALKKLREKHPNKIIDLEE